ncbi:MAG: YfiR family protein [Candidatus Berkiellales bacterium]
MKVLFLTVLLGTVSCAMANTNDEGAHKAQIIKQLLSVVEWPTGSIPNDSFNICTLGEFPSIKSITDLNGNEVKHRKIIVRQLHKISEAQNNCQLIYISTSEEKDTQKIIKAFAHKPVLLVGDMEHFAENGGSFNFTQLNKDLALTINLNTLKDGHLVIDLKAYQQITIFPELKEINK